MKRFSRLSTIANKCQAQIPTFLIATKRDDARKIRLLIDSGAKVSLRDSNNDEAISYADDKECLKILINAGANVNATTRHSQLTILMTASKQNDIDKIRLLLDSGANISLRDFNG